MVEFLIIIAILALIFTYWQISLALLALYLVYQFFKYKTNKSQHATEFVSTSVNYDILDGHAFEHFCADVLRYGEFEDVSVTRGSGDYGVDIIAHKDRQKYAIQCKCYSTPVGNKAVQEAYSGKSYYNADVAAVLTNRYFTQSAINTAYKNNVLLWDRNELNRLIDKALRNEEFRNINTKPSVLLSVDGTSDNSFIKQSGERKMYDTEKGIYPSGNYEVGTDIPVGKYILTSKGNTIGTISIYSSYKNYKSDNLFSYNSFEGDYHLSLREEGLFVDIENADIRRI